MLNTTIEIAAGRILVRPSFADMLVCRSIPGAIWDVQRKLWSIGATRETASRLQSMLRTLSATPEFLALLGAQPPTVAPVLDPAGVSSANSDNAAVAAEGAITLREDALPAAPVPEFDVVLPDGMKTSPWRHQRAAFKFCLDRFELGRTGLLLAMGMGTGKSLVACLVMLHVAARHVLIACPLRVTPVWITQLERHVAVPVVAIALDQDAGSVADKTALATEKMKLAETLGVPFVAIINYDSAWREPFASWAEKQSWDLVVADECHRLKGPSGKASRFFRRLRPKAKYRLGMSGTPMPHSPMDIFAPVAFLDTRIFGNSNASFRQRYAVMGGYQRKQITGYQNLDKLEELLSLITFRVGKEVLDLPPATHVTYYCDLSPEAARIYRDEDQDMIARVKDGMITAANVMVKLLRLQQITGGTVPTDEGPEVRIDDSKRRLLADTLEDIGSDEPVVVFCRFHADLDAVHQACESLAYTSLELSGRRDEIKRWQDGEAQVLAVQIRSGGEGVDLTRARYSIYYSLSFSLGEYDQSLARIHRPGQTRPVEHIHLIARNTVDVKIMHALERRAEVVEAILAEIKN